MSATLQPKIAEPAFYFTLACPRGLALFANKQANANHGGNVAAYIEALIRRDRKAHAP